MTSTMIMLAGPNDAGKSTLYETRIAPSLAGPFINANIIQRDELRTLTPAAPYKAADIASLRRTDYLARERDFVTDTVFSHRSKLELIDGARNRGFTIIVMMSALIRRTFPSRLSARVSRKEGMSSLRTRFVHASLVAPLSSARNPQSGSRHGV